jgi:hypothetical protein
MKEEKHSSEHAELKVNMAVIKEKLDQITNQLERHLARQIAVDKDQDARINTLEEVKASKEDIKQLDGKVDTVIKMLIGGLIGISGFLAVTVLTAIITKIQGLW